MADADATNDAAFDIEEDGADALVADFIVSALDHVDGTQAFEEDGARLFQQQQQLHTPLVTSTLPACLYTFVDWFVAGTSSRCGERVFDAFLSRIP
jgi:hypothetical protein